MKVEYRIDKSSEDLEE